LTSLTREYEWKPRYAEGFCPGNANSTIMNPSLAIYRGLKRAGIDFATSVPCVNLQQLLTLVGEDPQIIHVPVTREEEGVGLCAGAWMAGRRTALLMQNSGLGNCINALASLDFLYAIPLLMIISHRGGRGEPIIGQVPMGRLTGPLLDAMEIPHFSPACREAEDAVNAAWSLAAANRRPAAILLDLDFWRGA
jgi:sulfopyruvate decarboxylase subunit alpha